RRRHTRWPRDWSSDVCSSDLKGTLFLDEIGDLPIGLQPKLLHAIETQQATPLGSVRPFSCNLRIVSATNRDLAAALRAGTFRERSEERRVGKECRSGWALCLE